MAQESKRGCGYRKAGGLYLCGGYISVPCDRLPYELKSCPVCGAGIHFTRNVVEVNPLKLFGLHDQEPSMAGIVGEVTGHGTTATCTDKVRPCFMCDPTEKPAYIMTVGAKSYTPASFLKEAKEMGVSKKIAQIPKSLKLGETVVYLSHPDAVQVKVEKTEDKKGNSYLLPKEEYEGRLGIFMAFIPNHIEMPCWESQLKGKKGKAFKESLEKRGITPVPLKDGDNDHK